MEMDKERKARLEKMVATKQLSLALETEGERRAKKKFGFNLDCDWSFQKQNFSRNELTRPVMGTIFSSYHCQTFFLRRCIRSHSVQKLTRIGFSAYFSSY